LAVALRRAIVTAFICALALLFVAPAAQADLLFHVNSAGNGVDYDIEDNVCDTGNGTNVCTLRAAIQQANNTNGHDTIRFAIPGGGVRTISPQSNLPAVQDPVTINGYSQPGSKANTGSLTAGDDAVLNVQIQGSSDSSTDTRGLMVGSSGAGSLIRGLDINRFDTQIELARIATVEGNFLGPNPNATASTPTGTGLFVDDNADGPVIGGTDASARNIISGNLGSGIETFATVRVQGNYIGTQRDGTSALRNHVFGVGLQPSSGFTTVGGADAANVIAHNGNDGINSGTQEPGFYSRNRIFANGRKGIYLGQPNNRPAAFLETAVRRPGRTIVTGTLAYGMEGQPATVEFFVNPPDGDEGKKFIGDLQVTPDAGGQAPFRFQYGQAITAGKAITATGTGFGFVPPGYGTSEFSEPKPVKNP
jgi:hypothetical protein